MQTRLSTSNYLACEKAFMRIMLSLSVCGESGHANKAEHVDLRSTAAA